MLDAPVSPAMVITDHDSIVRVFRTRRLALGINQLAFDERTGLPSGYQGKLEAMLTRPDAKNARGIGRTSLPLVLGALRAELVMVPAGSVAVRERIPADVSGKAGGEARARNTSPERRREIAARWAPSASASP